MLSKELQAAEKKDYSLQTLEKLWDLNRGEDFMFIEILRIAILRRRELIKSRLEEKQKNEIL